MTVCNCYKNTFHGILFRVEFKLSFCHKLTGANKFACGFITVVKAELSTF